MTPRLSRPRSILRLWRRALRDNQIVLWAAALTTGVVVGYGSIGFRLAIGQVQRLFDGFSAEAMHSLAAALPWWQRLLAPAAGGLLVGLLLRWLMPGGRPQGVAAVIEAGAIKDGRLTAREGVGAAVIAATSLGVGASAGREGPVVHLGAALASLVAQRLRFNRSLTMTLLGCGVAAAVAASFNAPIAGVFFALEVVIGHYALHAFAPIVLASVAGTVVSRAHLGDFPAFVVPGYEIASLWEFPAVFALGLVAALVAMAFMWSIMYADSGVSRIRGLPDLLVPAVGGLVVGVIAVFFPQVLGVGYEATDAALKGQLPLWLLLALMVLKTAATAVSLGCRFGGGVFSPSLYVGAMTGGAFALIVAAAFPTVAADQGLYAVVGMGAVAAAVLGAPISTILIVFELTGDYRVTLMVMVAVAVACFVTQQTLGKFFFQWQLQRQGLNLAGGRALNLLGRGRVRDVMTDRYQEIRHDTDIRRIRQLLQTAPHGDFFVTDDDGRLIGTLTFADLKDVAFDADLGDLVKARDIAQPDPTVLEGDDGLDKALREMEAAAEENLPVVDSRERMRVIGILHFKHLLLAYNRALLQARAEERGER